jgi:PAS domain S-box-containing protein
MKTTIDSYHDIIVEIEDYAILLLDEAGTVRDWNKGAEKLKGYKAEEIVGKNFRLFYTEEDREKKLPEKLIKKATQTGKAIDEGWRVRKDGSRFWGSILITALHDEENKLTGFLKITRDLTERKGIEEKLRQANHELEIRVKDRTTKLAASELQFRHTLENMLEGVQIHDFNWRYLYVNDALVKYSTYSKEELLGHTLMEKYPGIEQTDLFKVMKRCMTERVAEHLETEFIFPDATKADFELSIQPMPEGIFILSVDITERKKAEGELIKANRLYAFISAINQSIVHIKNEQELLNNACKVAIEVGRFKMAWIGLLDENSKLNMISLLGDEAATQDIQKYSGLDYSSPQLRDTPTGKVLSTGHYAVSNDVQNDPVMRPWREDYVRHGIKANISFPIKKFGKIIGVFGFNSTIGHFFDDAEIILLKEAANDVSFALENFEREKLRRQAEENLARNELKLKEAQFIAKTGSWELDMINNVVSWSDGFFNLLGLNRNEDIPSNDLFLSMAHPDESELVNSGINKTFETFSNSSRNFRLVRKDKTIIHVHCEWKFEFDQHRKPTRIYGIVQDITEIKKAEDEIISLNETLEKRVKERTASLSEANQQLESFSYTVSHDLRSPLQVINGYASILAKKYSANMDDAAKELLQGIKDYTKKMARTMEDLLNFSRLGRAEVAKSEVNMNDLVRVVVEELSAGSKDFMSDFDIKMLAPANCDKGLMHQVWTNLISNAVKYSKKGGVSVIEIGCSKADGENIYYVKDNGVGFDMQYADKLFGVFQRLHKQSEFEGTGIGLALVHSIIIKHGGRIWAEAKVGEGATFYFTLSAIG